MFTGDESKREKHYRGSVATSPRVMSEPASLVTPATLCFPNDSTTAPAASSAGSDLLDLSWDTSAPSLSPAQPSTPSTKAEVTTPPEARLSKDTILALLGPKSGTNAAAPHQSRSGQFQFPLGQFGSIQASPNSALSGPKYNQPQQPHSQPSDILTRQSLSGCRPILPGVGQAASDVASLSPVKTRSAKCVVERAVSSKLAKKQIRLKSLTSYLEENMRHCLMVKDGREVQFALSEVRAFPTIKSQDPPETQQADPEMKARIDETGYLPGVACRLGSLSLSWSASHDHGPPTLSHSPSHNNLQQDPESKRTKY